MSRVANLTLVTAALVLVPVWVGAAAGRAEIESSPEQYYEGAWNNAHRRLSGDHTGTSWTWHARFPMDGFVESYLATRDLAWLDQATRYFDWTIGLLQEGPDGYKGWLGPATYQGREESITEHPIGDAIMYGPMLRFGALVLASPDLAEPYGGKAREYAELAARHMFEKWDRRGIWHEDGPYGVYAGWPCYFTKDDPAQWQRSQAGSHGITLPFNMQCHFAADALHLYRITAEKAHRDRALRMFNFTKSRLCLFKDHYVWNYWEPFGEWDIDRSKPNALFHWVGTHPYRDYQAGEVRHMVEGYHAGLTFDETDMGRLVNTNLKVMWNGSADDPQWANSNAAARSDAYDGKPPQLSPPNGIFDRYAGALWTGLLDFDATLRRLHAGNLKPGSYQHAYYSNVVAAREPTYERRHPELPVTVFDHPFSPSKHLKMVAAMPSVVVRAKGCTLASMCRAPAAVRISLLSEDGERRITEMWAGPDDAGSVTNAPVLVEWDPKDVPPGRYRVRWTAKDEYREFPITIQ